MYPSIRSRIARLFRNVAIPVCFAISFFGGPVWLDIYESASGDSLPPRVPDIMPSNAQNAQAVHEPNSLWVKKVAGVLVPGGSLGKYRHGTYPSIENQRGKFTHMGIDILAACGTPIFLSEDALVVDVIDSRDDPRWEDLGYAVMLQPSDSTEESSPPQFKILLHLEMEPSISKDKTAYAWKTEIGRIGDTGKADGCHTHIELRNFRTWLYPHPLWNNIYGLGDVTSSTEYLQNWSDPVSSEAVEPFHTEITFSADGEYLFHHGERGNDILLCVATVSTAFSNCLGEIVLDRKSQPEFFSVAAPGSPKPLSDSEVVFLARASPVDYASPCSALFASHLDGSGVRRISNCLKPQSVDGFALASDPIRGLIAVYQQGTPPHKNEITIFDGSGARVASLPFDFQEIQAGSMVFLSSEPKLIAPIHDSRSETLSIYEIDIHSGQRGLRERYHSPRDDLRDAGLAVSSKDRYMAYRAPTGEMAVNETYPLEQYEIFRIDRISGASRRSQLTHNAEFEKEFFFLDGGDNLIVAMAGGELGLLSLREREWVFDQIHQLPIMDLAVSAHTDSVALQTYPRTTDSQTPRGNIDLILMSPDGSELRRVLLSQH